MAGATLTANAVVQATSDSNFGKIVEYSWAWTSNANGSIVATASTGANVSGLAMGANFVPGSGVSDNYDVYIKDANGVDILFAAGVDLSNDATDSGNYCGCLTGTGTYPYLRNANLSLTVKNAGNAKTGVVKLYVQRQ